VINDAKIIVSGGMVTIGLDSAFETLLGFLVALHSELAHPDFVEHGRIPRRDFQGGLVEVQRVEIVLILAQFVAAFLEGLGRCSGSGRIGAVQRRRANLQLFGVLSLRWENEERGEEKRYRTDADPGKHIPPPPNLLNFRDSWRFSVLCQVPCTFETAKPVPTIDIKALCIQALLSRRRAVVIVLRRRRRALVISLGAAVSLEYVNDLAEEAFLFLGLFL